MTTVAPGDGAPEGRVNIAPMGPVVDETMTRMILRPFTSSTTYRNLKASGQGVFHVTDDAMLIARAAIGQVGPDDHDVALRAADRVEGLVLAGACRFYEVEVDMLNDREERTRIEVRVVAQGRLRDFLGFNRARHALVEAAILATRVHLTGRAHVLAEFERLWPLVDKTGAEPEHASLASLERFVRDAPA